MKLDLDRIFQISLSIWDKPNYLKVIFKEDYYFRKSFYIVMAGGSS